MRHIFTKEMVPMYVMFGVLFLSLITIDILGLG